MFGVKEKFGVFRDWAIGRWEDAHGILHPWGPSEFKCLQTGFERTGEDARNSWEAFLADCSPYIEGHSPRKWSADLSKWAVAGAKLKPEGVGEYLVKQQAKPANLKPIPKPRKGEDRMMFRKRLQIHFGWFYPKQVARDKASQAWKAQYE